MQDARARSALVNVDPSTFRSAKVVRSIGPGPTGQPGPSAAAQKAPTSPQTKIEKPVPQHPVGLMTPQQMGSTSKSSTNGGIRARIHGEHEPGEIPDGRARVPSVKREPGEISDDERPPTKRVRRDAPSGQPAPGPSAPTENSVPRANGVRLDGSSGRPNGRGHAPAGQPPRPPKPRPKKPAAASMFIPKKKPGPG